MKQPVQNDNRIEEAVQLLREKGPCSYSFLKEQVTQPSRGLWAQMINDERLVRGKIGGVVRWRIRG